MAIKDTIAEGAKTQPRYSHTTRELIRFVHEDSQGEMRYAITVTCDYNKERDHWLGECVELGTATFADTFEQMRLELREAVELQLTGVSLLSGVQDYLDYLAECGVAIAEEERVERLGA